MKARSTEAQPAPVSRPDGTTQAGEIRARWSWVEPTAWSDRMLTALEHGVKGGVWLAERLLRQSWAVLRNRRLRSGPSIPSGVNHRPESRVRENRMHGSEGGGTGNSTGPSYPYPGSSRAYTG